ncbi:hypothetical protein [Rathayibacter sp. VKM Ac-2801]|uniref:hypothetical protein n=1 Tax=Rathayibacter sp. VKM Ac-2801 TaxID=2609255 RepID=UPI00131FDD66|nr:hypothetical protein [Rathayibacter sp. VKM Ac-2801]QHC69477.1 hypothetical protein GSU45_03145 [Rathayibacter sp. VKM Ac-2801]
MARLHEAGDGMARSTGANGSPRESGGTDEGGTDPRYHAGFQRGYDGREAERRGSGEERLRSPVLSGGATGTGRSVDRRGGGSAPEREDVRSAGGSTSPLRSSRRSAPEGARAAVRAVPAPAEPTAPRPAEPSVPRPNEPTVPLPAEPDSAPRDAAPDSGDGRDATDADHDARSAVSTRRIAGALAVVGAVSVLLGLLALWHSSHSWYDYSPSQSAFGPEQYLRVLSDNAIGPFLTVGLIALGLAVVAPLLRAPRR